MNYEEVYEVQVLKATGWTTLAEYDTETEARDGLNYYDHGTQSFQVVRKSEVTVISRMRAR